MADPDDLPTQGYGCVTRPQGHPFPSEVSTAVLCSYSKKEDRIAYPVFIQRCQTLVSSAYLQLLCIKVCMLALQPNARQIHQQVCIAVITEYHTLEG